MTQTYAFCVAIFVQLHLEPKEKFNGWRDGSNILAERSPEDLWRSRNPRRSRIDMRYRRGSRP